MAKYLLKEQTENGDSGWIATSSCFARADQQTGILHVDGPFDGATVTIRTRPAGSTRDGQIVEDGVFTEGAAKETALSPSMMVKATVTDAGSSTDIDVWLG